ncbi:MAG: glycosyltransferase, partial [Gemmatimonadales bacterium]
MIVAILLLLPVGLMLYAYLVYPLLLRAGSIAADGKLPAEDPPEWPTVSITVPAHNEAGSIGDTIEALLTLDYPAERRQILIVSDASTDGTDDIVRRYANRGVELLRLETRGGKTAAENAAARHLTGEIVINTDATIRILPDALKPLIRVFQDRTIGVASG